MMFNKDLFLSICERYDVEFSHTAENLMISDGISLHPITDSDVKRVFSPCQTFFGYTENKVNAKIEQKFCLEDDYGIAC